MDDLKLKFIEIKNGSPVMDDNGEYQIIYNIDNVKNAAIIIPEGYIGLKMYKLNYNKFYYMEPKDEQEEAKYWDFNIGKKIVEYCKEDNFYWTYFREDENEIVFGISLIFKKPKEIKVEKNVYYAVGGYKALFVPQGDIIPVICFPCKNAFFKENADELVNFTEKLKDIIVNTIKLPVICYPLLKCDDKINFINRKEYVNASRKQLKSFLRYVVFEYPNAYTIDISNPYDKSYKTYPVNGVADTALDFINRTFFYNTLNSSEDCWNLIGKISKIASSSFELTSFESIDDEKIDYIWYPYIPLGSIVLLAGDPGAGKSYLSLKIAAIISNGDKFPFENRIEDSSDPSLVIIQNGEDGKGTTIKPRLKKLGADISKIQFIEGKGEQFRIDNVDILEEYIYLYRPKLIIIDPITQYLPPKISMDKANDVRNALYPLADLADRYKCTFLIIAHKNKTLKTDGLYRVLGSIDFVGICRSMLVATKVKEGITYLSQEKNSTSEFGKSIEYHIDDNGLEFIRQVDKVLEEADKPIEEAKQFILDQLAGGEVLATDIRTLAYSEGISKNTLDRAKKVLNVKSQQRFDSSGNKYWVWSLAEPEMEKKDEK